MGRYFLPYNPKLVERAKELRANQTPAEKKIWYGLLRDFRYRVLRQRPIDQYIVDFYCARLRLVIEIDGDAHFIEEGKEYDQQRTAALDGLDLRAIRFTNRDVMDHFEEVCKAIMDLANDLDESLATNIKG